MSNVKIKDMKHVDYLSSICGRYIAIEFDIEEDDEGITVDWFLYDVQNETLVNYTTDYDDKEPDAYLNLSSVLGYHDMGIVILSDMETNSSHSAFILKEMHSNPEFNKRIKTLVIDSMI